MLEELKEFKAFLIKTFHNTIKFIRKITCYDSEDALLSAFGGFSWSFCILCFILLAFLMTHVD